MTPQILVSAESRELESLLRARGISVQREALAFGDACFEGNGPQGTMLIGIELKKLHDMLTCIDDARYSAHQRTGMAQMYRVSILNLQGLWRPHDQSDLLMEGHIARTGELVWAYCRPAGRTVMYSKLRRYLFSVTLSGVHVTYTRDVAHTAQDIIEWYWYFQKKWRDHTALLEMQKLNIPSLTGKPSLVRRWAADLEGIGVKLSDDAARIFKRPITLATADEVDWVRVPGVGVKTAQSIWREIHGLPRQA
jgi:ERCC4-type nuclease